MEDAPLMATFNYFGRGFSEPPTAYYLRPFSIAIERKVENDCYLDKSEIEVFIRNNCSSFSLIIIFDYFSYRYIMTTFTTSYEL